LASATTSSKLLNEAIESYLNTKFITQAPV
jgi:hypothetical protein